MTDLRLEREFSVTPERLFHWITTPEKLLKWWGPEGMDVPEHDLNFNRTGPWFSIMRNGEGQQFKVSGHVTHVDAPKSVGFTWGWHDDDDQRGGESHVTFTVVSSTSGARLLIDHRDLDDSEQSARHESGWTSSLRKLATNIT
ncbi:SRPBCC domain-containing protein [Parasedimentitalea marina]|uniref:SRPBCC domain-containing protein n=1 Tax=Parasedimentitalea marina TaxID=2483033 RepID=A0A3T0N8C5_9RHOB|nr:SRPBCC domain-containing protein [Parasedimentitalea marina]AZV80212.1 SRPBCC domain-containing protein [Parasedimentitalea marina]